MWPTNLIDNSFTDTEAWVIAGRLYPCTWGDFITIVINWSIGAVMLELEMERIPARLRAYKEVNAK
jgi:hypothetical protein